MLLSNFNLSDSRIGLDGIHRERHADISTGMRQREPGILR